MDKVNYNILPQATNGEIRDAIKKLRGLDIHNVRKVNGELMALATYIAEVSGLEIVVPEEEEFNITGRRFHKRRRVPDRGWAKNFRQKMDEWKGNNVSNYLQRREGMREGT